MPHLGPIKRKDLIYYLRRLGFEGPYPGGNHQYMVKEKGNITLTIPNPHPCMVQRIVSGGQTGADRAALDWAIQHGIPHAGWCPHGRLAEDGQISERYMLQETPSWDYAQRTEWNVRDSDGTVIFSIAPHLTAGSHLTRYFAEQYGKPYLHIHKAYAYPARMLLEFLRRYDIHVLNIAGPRASTEPEVGQFVLETLDETWG